MWLCAGIQRRGINLKSVAPGGDSAGNERATLAHLRSKVMPTQEKFDPVVYLGTVHWVSVKTGAGLTCHSMQDLFMVFISS